MRHTSSHSKNRRSHHALKNRVIVTDKESGALRLPHRLDETTGMYRGKLIAPAKAKVTVEPKKAKAKKAKKEKEEVETKDAEVTA
jgi:ribosomal protein L32